MRKMKHLLIVGAGGFGRELVGIAQGSLGFGETFDVAGFLDARADALADFTGYPPIVGDPQTYQPAPDDVFITALGDVAARQRCVETLAARGARFLTLVHRSASVDVHAHLGDGVLVAQNAVVSADAVIGDHTCVFQGAVIGHDARLGAFAHVYALSVLGGGVTLGDGAVVYPGARIVPRRKIGAHAVIGIGAIVLTHVRDGETIFQLPATRSL